MTHTSSANMTSESTSTTPHTVQEHSILVQRCTMFSVRTSTCTHRTQKSNTEKAERRNNLKIGRNEILKVRTSVRNTGSSGVGPKRLRQSVSNPTTPDIDNVCTQEDGMATWLHAVHHCTR